MKKMMKLFAVVAMVGLLGACSALGLAPATSPSQALAYAYGTLAGIRTGASNALMAGTISTSTAQTILADTDKARSALDAGETLLIAGSTDTTSISGDIATATALITQAQALLPVTTAAPAAGASTPLSGTAL